MFLIAQAVKNHRNKTWLLLMKLHNKLLLYSSSLDCYNDALIQHSKKYLNRIKTLPCLIILRSSYHNHNYEITEIGARKSIFINIFKNFDILFLGYLNISIFIFCLVILHGITK